MTSLEEAVKSLFMWRYHHTGCFMDCVYNLFSNADPANFTKLAKAFPREAIVFELWKIETDGGRKFFASYNLYPSLEG